MIRKMTTMDLSNALHLIIQTAVVKNRQLRFIDLIKTERGLHKFVAQLDHFEHYIKTQGAMIFDKPQAMETFIRENLSLEDCACVLSTQKEYKQGKMTTVRHLLQDLVGAGNGTLAFAGKNPLFCFYLGEDVSVNYAWRIENTECQKVE